MFYALNRKNGAYCSRRKHSLTSSEYFFRDNAFCRKCQSFKDFLWISFQIDLSIALTIKTVTFYSDEQEMIVCAWDKRRWQRRCLIHVIWYTRFYYFLPFAANVLILDHFKHIKHVILIFITEKTTLMPVFKGIAAKLKSWPGSRCYF